MNNHVSVPPVKRLRLSDNINVTRTSEPAIQSIVNTVNTAWKDEYNRMLQEVVSEINHCDLVSKYNDLEIGHAELVKAHHDLLLLYKSQCLHIDQLPTETEVSRLNERIIEMEAEKQRDLKKIVHLQKDLEAGKARIAEFQKKEATARHALESEKEKCAGLYKIIDDLKASNKDRGQIIEQMKKQQELNKAKTTNLEQRKRKAEHSAPVKEKVVSEGIAIEPTRKARVRNRKAAKKQQEASEANLVEPQKEREAARNVVKSKAPQKEKVTSAANIVEPQTKQVAPQNVRNEETVSLKDKKLSWAQYERYINYQTIKSLRLVRVRIEKPNGNLTYIEEIMYKLPDIQKFECVFGTTGSVILDRTTFSIMLRSPPFKNLQNFNLYGVSHEQFDADSFLKFVNRNPECKFKLIFHVTCEKNFNALAKKLRQAVPSEDKLFIDSMRPEHNEMFK